MSEKSERAKRKEKRQRQGERKALREELERRTVMLPEAARDNLCGFRAQQQAVWHEKVGNIILGMGISEGNWRISDDCSAVLRLDDPSKKESAPEEAKGNAEE